MFYEDVKFMQRLSPSLIRCSQIDQYTWNFRCPFCGDSEHDPNKTRGYVYHLEDHLVFKCHNCGISTSFPHLLKFVSPSLYSEFSLNRYRDRKNNSTPVMELLQTPKVTLSPRVDNSHQVVDSVLDGLESVDHLPETHEAVEYLKARLVPRETWSYVYHVEDFNGWLTSLDHPKGILKNLGKHSRLTLPTLDQHGHVGSVAARAYPGSSAEHVKRYTSVTFDPSIPRVFGMDRVSFREPVVVLEGQLDSLFLRNAVAVEGSTLDIGWVNGIHGNVILVQDNEPRNPQITAHMRNYISSGYRVTIFPKWVVGKDINEMILGGLSREALNDIIQRYSYTGLEARMRYSEWINT